MIQRSYT